MADLQTEVQVAVEDINKIVAEINRIGKQRGFSITEDMLPYIIKKYVAYQPYERNKLLENLKLKGLTLEEFRKITQEDAKNSEVMIPDNIYDKLMSEVMALPPRKRKNYKSTLMDKSGTNSRVIYDGELKNYSMIYGRFVRVVKHSTFLKDYKMKTATTKVGYEIVKGMDPDEVMNKAIEENSTGNHQGRVNYRVKIPAPCDW
jgi:hypothetical protein